MDEDQHGLIERLKDMTLDEVRALLSTDLPPDVKAKIAEFLAEHEESDD